MKYIKIGLGEVGMKHKVFILDFYKFSVTVKIVMKGVVAITFHLETPIPEGVEDPPKWLDEWILGWVKKHDLELTDTTEIEAFVLPDE